jgi:hypothetical protein
MASFDVVSNNRHFASTFEFATLHNQITDLPRALWILCLFKLFPFLSQLLFGIQELV